MSYSGPLARKARIFPLGTVAEIVFGYVGRPDSESMATLNIMLSQAVPFWSRRHIVGYWLCRELKEQLFQAIEAFVELHDLGIRMTKCD